MLNTDNRETIPYDVEQGLHSYRMQTDPEYAARVNFEAETSNQALQDQSLLMALAGNGVKPLVAYGSVPTHTASRIVNAVANKDATRLLGMPTKNQIKRAISNEEGAIDKLLWKGTGNAVKLDMVNK